VGNTFLFRKEGGREGLSDDLTEKPTPLDNSGSGTPLLSSSSKTRLLPYRVKIDGRTGLHVHVSNKLATYFSLIRIPSHRLAYFRFITSNHRLAVEVLRWERSGADYIPEQWRLCRFCQSDIENEVHAFMICGGSPDLLDARSVLFTDLYAIDPDLRLLLDPQTFMITVLRRSDTIVRVAKYVHMLHSIFTSTPVIVPPVNSYRTII
jgi:hypothetical protein